MPLSLNMAFRARISAKPVAPDRRLALTILWFLLGVSEEIEAILRDVNCPSVTSLCASKEGQSFLDLLAILTPAFERAGKAIESPAFQQALKKLLKTWVNPECLNEERINGSEFPGEEYFTPGLAHSSSYGAPDSEGVGIPQLRLFSQDAILDAQARIAFYAERDKEREAELAQSSLLLQEAGAAEFNRRLQKIKESFE